MIFPQIRLFLLLYSVINPTLAGTTPPRNLNLTCHFCGASSCPQMLLASEQHNATHCDVGPEYGCVFIEYWDKKKNKVGMEQRCVEDADLHGQWNVWQLVNNYNDMKKHCYHYINTNTGDKMEKCICKSTLCNKNMLASGGIGDPAKFNGAPSPPKTLSTRTVFITLTFILLSNNYYF